MDLKANHSAPTLTDPIPITKPRLGIHDSLLPYPSSGMFSQGLFLTLPWKKPVILDDVLSTSWLDAMKSSSPRNITKNDGIDFSPNDADVAYRNWMYRCGSPSSPTLDKEKVSIFIDCGPTVAPQFEGRGGEDF